MAISSSSSWGKPRSWKLLTLTLLGLTLLVIVPLHQLGDQQSTGLYTRLTNYLGHESTSYDPADGFVANFKESDTASPILETDSGDATESNDKTPEPVDVVREPARDEDKKDEAEVQPDMNIKNVEEEEVKPLVDEDVLQVDVAEPERVTGDSSELADEKTMPAKKLNPVETKPVEGTKPTESKSVETQEEPNSGKSTQAEKIKDADGSHSMEEAKSEVDHNTNGQKNDLRDDEGQVDGAGEDPEGDGKNSQDGQNSQNGQSDQEDTDENETEGEGGRDSDDNGVEESVKKLAKSPACEGFPDTEGIMLVMKTGATEAFDKLPTHLLTDLQCMDDFLLFSDLKQQIGPYEIHDVLEDVKEDVRHGRKEFTLYQSQVDCPISQKDCTGNMKGGWDLDKYKFLHMVERAWEMRPNMEWYVFAEADTYIFWSNLVDWLRNRADPTKTPYVGSVAMLKGMPFAHGGSGYVIHGQTVRNMVQIPDLADKYDKMATHECCGDYLMSLAVNETGFKVKNAHPMFNGEKPSTLPYGNGHWCEPLLTMHHMSAEEVSAVWQYEKSRQKKGTLLINEMYHAFFKSKMMERRDEWDNLSDDVCYIGPEPEAQGQASDHQKRRQKKENDKNIIERRAHFSEEHCAKVCQSEGLGIDESDYIDLGTEEERSAMIQAKYQDRSEDSKFHGSRRCFQWRYHKNACCIARSFKLGKPRREEKPEEKWTSGWFVQGINDWIEAKGECQPRWKEIR